MNYQEINYEKLIHHIENDEKDDIGIIDPQWIIANALYHMLDDKLLRETHYATNNRIFREKVIECIKSLKPSLYDSLMAVYTINRQENNTTSI